jgi:Pyruvate/2-oxoacid:ferredoxin oxidoreductase delta subunit
MKDLIDRQAAIDEIINLWADKPFGNPALVEIKDCIEKLPSVTPQQKVGHWIWQEGYINYCKCSECGMGEWEMEWNFCPNCGAKMVESEESDADSD